MALEYEQHSRHEAAFDPARCKASVHKRGGGWGIYQCQHLAKRDGWCSQHHPDTAQASRDAWDANYKAERAEERRKDRRESANNQLIAAALHLASTHETGCACPICEGARAVERETGGKSAAQETSS